MNETLINGILKFEKPQTNYLQSKNKVRATLVNSKPVETMIKC